jgi:hypothetical protein
MRTQIRLRLWDSSASIAEDATLSVAYEYILYIVTPIQTGGGNKKVGRCLSFFLHARSARYFTVCALQINCLVLCRVPMVDITVQQQLNTATQHTAQHIATTSEERGAVFRFVFAQMSARRPRCQNFRQFEFGVTFLSHPFVQVYDDEEAKDEEERPAVDH